MPAPEKIARALISVSDKTGLVEFGRFLANSGVEVLSTGGSAKALAEAGVKVKEVGAHTGFPEIMDGRVKTLHPLIHGGILGRRRDSSHMATMRQHGIAPIDLVVVNLYPFEQTVAAGADFELIRRPHKSPEQRMRLQRLRLELGVELAAPDVRMLALRHLNNLDVGSIGRGAADPQAGGGKRLLVFAVAEFA